jgi:hypothetical protein
MNENFVPEMHDLGKLVDNNVVQSLLGVDIDGHYFRASDKSDLDFAKIGVKAPSSATWTGIQHHNDAEYKAFARSPLSGVLKAKMVLNALADVLAASTSRATPEEKGEFQYPASYKAVYRLWNPRTEKTAEHWSPIRGMSDLREMIEFVNQDPNAEAFFAKYQPYLEGIPEDKTPPRVVTSLMTHLRLVGKYFGVLEKHSQPLLENGEPIALVYDKHLAASIGEMLDHWQYQLVKCKLSFPQTPVRVRDLNIFTLLEEHTKRLLTSEFGDYVLFHTTDTFYFFLPTDGSVQTGQILKPHLEDGFFIETEETISALNALNLAPEESKFKCQQRLRQAQGEREALQSALASVSRELARLRNEMERRRTASDDEKRRLGRRTQDQARIRRDLESELQRANDTVTRWEKNLADFNSKKLQTAESSIYAEPIAARHELDTDLICELCQMRPAARIWTTPDELLAEHLCDVCYRVRDKGERHGAIGRWERETPNAPVAWVRLSLDYDWAQIHIDELFRNFIDELASAKPETPKHWAGDAKANLRAVALLADFTADYQRLTRRFAALLRNPADGSRGFAPQGIVELTHEFQDFYIVRLFRASDAVQMIESFRRALDEFFPKALEECPVRLSISIANVKHPFFEHWRFCQAAPNVINVQLVGRAQLHLSVAQYDELTTLPLRRREVSTFLHRVATVEAETHSRILPQVEFMQDERKLPENIAVALRAGKLGWRDVLNYYKLARR